MHCYQHPAEGNQEPIAIRKSNWHWKDLEELYLSDRKTSNFKKVYRSLSDIDKKRFALVEYVDQFQDRSLFHLSITYKPYQDKEYKESDVNHFFIIFYTRHFLPYVTGSQHYNRPGTRSIQPICYAFVDGHAHEPMRSAVDVELSSGQNLQYVYPAQLHHHAILAVHPSTLPKVQAFIGENTFANGFFSSKIMTSDLKECDAPRLFYASKLLKAYPDFLCFPDRCQFKNEPATGTTSNASIGTR